MINIKSVGLGAKITFKAPPIEEQPIAYVGSSSRYNGLFVFPRNIPVVIKHHRHITAR